MKGVPKTGPPTYRFVRSMPSSFLFLGRVGTTKILSVVAKKLAQMPTTTDTPNALLKEEASLPNLYKGLGDRGFSGVDTVSRLDFLDQIGLVG